MLEDFTRSVNVSVGLFNTGDLTLWVVVMMVSVVVFPSLVTVVVAVPVLGSSVTIVFNVVVLLGESDFRVEYVLLV